MGILPVLFVVIAIVSIASNYKKAQEKRISDQKKRMETLKAMRLKEKASEEKAAGDMPQKKPAALHETPVAQAVERIKIPDIRPVRSRVSAGDMRNAVIMAEILNKPVSLRDQ